MLGLRNALDRPQDPWWHDPEAIAQYTVQEMIEPINWQSMRQDWNGVRWWGDLPGDINSLYPPALLPETE